MDVESTSRAGLPRDTMNRGKRDTSFQEKSAWIMLAIVLGVYGWYFAVVFARVDDQVVGDIAYQGMMFATVVVLVVVAAITHTRIAIANPKAADQYDEKDRAINRTGQYIGRYFVAIGALVGIGLAMFEVEPFWIANALLAVLVLSEIVTGATKVALYRRGIDRSLTTKVVRR